MNKKHEELIKKAYDIDKKFARRMKDSLKDDINTPEGRKKFLEGKKILFACCFCPKKIENPEKASEIYVHHKGKPNQMYWCHTKCLLKKMTKRCRDEFQW